MTYVLTGIPVEPGAPAPIRPEITAFINDETKKIQVSLFIRALTTFQSMDVTDMKSFFQIAGIHGFPQVSWDGEPKEGQKAEAGFCTHNTITFPTWHRPYLVLFEKRLWEIMNEYIKTSVPADQKAQWTTEANKWRLPYWDWAKPQPYIGKFGVPEVCTWEKITIVTPATNRGTLLGRVDVANLLLGRVEVANPLWKFSNPSGKPMGDPTMGINAIKNVDDYPWSQCIATSRYGVDTSKDPSVWTNGVQNWQEVNIALQSPAWYKGALGSLSEAVYRLFTSNYARSWQTFASTSHANKDLPGSEWLSLEYIHNNLHNWTGGTDLKACGQMGSVPVAAFDPIFWLHHCNVDRQFAIWQTLNYDKWFDGSVETDPKPTDPLLPFHHDKEGHLYDSNMVRRWWDFGYHYKILEGVIDKNAQVNRLDLIRLRVRLAVLYGHTRGLVRSIPTMLGRENDYVLNVIYDRYALDGSPYTIHFFLGAPPESEVGIQYHKHPSHVGMVFTFSSKIADDDDVDAPGQCANCAKQKKAGVLSRAQLHLTSPLIKHALDLERIHIRDITREHVGTYLKDTLHWRAVDISGQTIDIPTRLPRTKIFAMAGIGRHEEETSEYGRYQPVWGATAGKPGGAAEADKGVLHVIFEN